MKSSTISTLGEDYITVAKARGLPERRILTAYVGRNAMLPLVTRLAISIGFVVGGSVIIETIFQYPGLGRLLYHRHQQPRLHHHAGRFPDHRRGGRVLEHPGRPVIRHARSPCAGRRAKMIALNDAIGFGAAATLTGLVIGLMCGLIPLALGLRYRHVSATP